MKKILYVYFGDFEENSGVTNKLKGLFSALKEKEAEFVFFTLSRTAIKPEYISENIYALPISYGKKHSQFYLELHNFLNQDKRFDIYFFRYPLANRFLIEFLKKHPKKFIFEHNTKELPEVSEQALFWINKFRFKLTPSYFRLLWSSLIVPVFNEFFYGKVALKLAKKGVAVTHEIKEYEVSRFKDYSCSVCSNGVDIKKATFYERSFSEGDVLNLVMLVSNHSAWHGVDLIIESLNSTTRNKINLFLVGNVDSKWIELASTNKNIILTGFLSVEEFEKYMQKAHVGIGTLALFRKKMKEASTLKVREYLASGLPVCLGYTDTDIEESKILKEYSLNIDLQHEPINWDMIYEWCLNMYQKKDLNKIIRNEAMKKIDFSVKAEILLSL